MSQLAPKTPATSRYNHANFPEHVSPDERDHTEAAMNQRNTAQDLGNAVSFASEQTPNLASIFRSNTIAPSPPPGSSTSEPNNSLPHLNTNSRLFPVEIQFSSPSPLSAGLKLKTDIVPPATAASANPTERGPSDSIPIPTSSRSSAKPSSIPLARTPSIKSILAGGIGSNSNLSSAPSSALSSPMLNAMADVTPLPSPLMSGDSPGPWDKFASRPASRDRMVSITADSALITTNGESISSAVANQSKRRAYHALAGSGNDSAPTDAQVFRGKNAEGHLRNRSASEYVPEANQVPIARHITVSGSHAPVTESTHDSATGLDTHMRREPHLAVKRGLAPIPRPPTPPSSRTGAESSDSDSSLSAANLARVHKGTRYEYFEAYTRDDSKRRRWRSLKLLGQGTFSRVMLATSQAPEDDRIDEVTVPGGQSVGIAQAEPKIDRRKLVAVKVCEHGPKGGASEERVEMSLKRELEIMKSIHHPSLVHLKAWNIEKSRAVLVLSYCPGGDLFDIASGHRDLLVPGLLRRIFSELVAAVKYLHERRIVHRDIKLENVLVNLPQHELARPQDWQTYPYSIITLTDLGLSRRVADDEKLTTRCGSDDYAAPEVIMGQPYDGRATDAWSLGVLLYALLESRLPFDPHPGMSEGHKQRSKTSHRIARVEWRWFQYAGDEGDHEGDPGKFRERGLEGAMLVTEGLLKRARSRWTLEQVATQKWVQGGIDVEGGISFREEENPEEILSSANIL